MIEPNPMQMVRRLLPRHTEAGIEVSYDYHCVSLRRDSKVLERREETCYRVAVWTGDVTFDQLVAEADHYLPKEVTV